MLYQFFCKTIYSSNIEAPAYSGKSLFKQTWIYTTRECFNRSIFFMVYGFHPPLPLPWIMILTKLNSVYLNMFLHNCRHIRLNCFWKEKIYKDVFFICLVKKPPPHITSHTPVTWFNLTYIYLTLKVSPSVAIWCS